MHPLLGVAVSVAVPVYILEAPILRRLDVQLVWELLTKRLEIEPCGHRPYILRRGRRRAFHMLMMERTR